MSSSKPFPRVLEDEPCYVPLLPHVGVDGHVALLADNAHGVPDSLGLAWKLSAVETEAWTDGDTGAFAMRMDNVLRNIPDLSVCQFILRATRNPRAKLALWEKATRSENPVFRDLAASRRAAIEKLSIATSASTFEPRSLEVLMTVRRAGTWPTMPVSLLAALRTFASPSGCVGLKDSPEARVAAAYSADRSRAVQLAETLESLLAQAGVPYERLDETGIAESLYAALNPRRSKVMPPPAAASCSGELLRERVALSSLEVDLDAGVVHVDDTYVKIVSVTQFPSPTRAGMLMRAAKETAFLDAGPELDLVLNVHVEDQEKIRTRFGGARRLATDQSKDAHQAPVMKNLVGELCEIEQEFADGGRIVSVRLHAVVRGRSEEEAGERARAVHAAFQAAGFRAMIENCLVGTLFLQALPFGYLPDADGWLRRGRKIGTGNLSHLVPVYGSFGGTGSPMQLLLNRRGEPVFLGFFQEKSASHAIYSGYTGGGKSSLSNDTILQALRTGGRAFVLDRGGSYRKLTEILGGTYVTYDARAPKRLNPCGRAEPDGTCPPETNTFLRDLLTEMVTHGKDDLPVRDQNLLSIAVRAAFAAKPGAEVFLSDVHAALLALAGEHSQAQVRDLALCLSDYVKDGPYARFFDGPDEIAFGSRLVAIDLADKALESAVTSVLVMAIMHRIGEASRAWPTDDKFLIIDEAWTLLKSPAAARFIENIARTARKLRLALIVVSQQITDLEGPIGAAIVAQTTYQMCLYQKAEAIPQAAKILQLNEKEVELYRSLHPPKDASFREILVKSPWSTGVGRLFLDPLTYWITTSDMKDCACLEEIVRKRRRPGVDEREALRLALMEAALKHPHGAPKEDPAEARNDRRTA